MIVDECSTVKNDDILTILSLLGGSALVLIGDTFQIEAIDFGNWFNICRKVMPPHCCHELTTPHRSTDKNLKKLWDEIRNMGDNNVALEQTVRNDYSHHVDEDIFTPRAEDEIIPVHALCPEWFMARCLFFIQRSDGTTVSRRV